MDNILNQIQEYVPGQIDSSVVGQTAETLAKVALPVLVAGLVFALLNCFFGLKLIRIWTALLGFIVGFTLGFGISAYFKLDTVIVLIIGVVAGIIIGALGFWLYLAGAFFLCWIFSASVVGLLVGLDSMVKIIVAAVAGLVVAIIAMKFVEPVIIIVTALHGGLAAGTYIAALASIENQIVTYVIGAVLVILGIVVQFVLESKRKVKMHVEKANKVRAENSTENEVNAARALLDGTDRIKEDKDAMDYYDDEDDDENPGKTIKKPVRRQKQTRKQTKKK